MALMYTNRSVIKNGATQNIHLAIATAFTGPFINLKNGNNRFFLKKSLAYSLKSK